MIFAYTVLEENWHEKQKWYMEWKEKERIDGVDKREFRKTHIGHFDLMQYRVWVFKRKEKKRERERGRIIDWLIINLCLEKKFHEAQKKILNNEQKNKAIATKIYKRL